MKYFVFSHYINAWTLWTGMAKLKYNLLCISNTDGLLAPTKGSPQPGDTLFFTEESSLKKYYSYKDQYNFYPKEMDFNLIDDKLAFAKKLDKINEKPVPYWEICNNPGVYPIYIKARHSWLDDMKLPRGFICNNEKEYTQNMDIINKKYSIDKFFHQKLLMSSPSNNISTCGFFDYKKPQRNLIIVTRKLLSDAGKIGCGAIVQTIDDPERLVERTINILNSLHFAGAFELEFFYEECDKCYYVLELNPRFWMQHGIFVSYFNNGLIKRYLNIDTPSDWKYIDTNYPKTTWFDSIYLLNSIVHLSPKTLINYILELINNKSNGHYCLYPDIYTGLSYILKSIYNKLRNKIST